MTVDIAPTQHVCVAGLRMDDVWAARVLRDRGIEVSRADDQPCLLRVLVEQVSWIHYGQERNYRPALHVCGQLRSITPDTLDSSLRPWPYGVSEVTYSPARGESVDAFYDFTDEQLGRLVGKGYFQAGFEPPEAMSGIVWELPARVDLMVMGPADPQDVPVVFVCVHDVNGLALNEETSGYDLVDSFPQRSSEKLALQDMGQAGVEQLKERADRQQESLFGDLDDELDEVAEAGSPDAGDESELARQLREVHERLDERKARHEHELADTAGTPQNLYREQVRPQLRSSTAGTLGNGEPYDDSISRQTGQLHDAVSTFADLGSRARYQAARRAEQAAAQRSHRDDAAYKSTDADIGPEL